jgi:hypothetical protein
MRQLAVGRFRRRSPSLAIHSTGISSTAMDSSEAMEKQRGHDEEITVAMSRRCNILGFITLRDLQFGVFRVDHDRVT